MIEIKCVDEQSINLTIWGYEFPDNKSDEYDSNWLRVFTEVNSKQGKWKSIDPNLALTLVQNDKKAHRIKIHFDLESRPPSAADDEEYSIEFESSQDQLEQLIVEFEKELSNYPLRGKP